jgi:hypothetical protein
MVLMLFPNAFSEISLAKPWWDMDIIILVAESCSAWVKKRDKYDELGKTDFDVVPTSFHIMYFMFHIHHSLLLFFVCLFVACNKIGYLYSFMKHQGMKVSQDRN